MIKKFCDLCEKPARERYPRIGVPIGKPYSDTRCDGPSVVQGSSWQRRIEITCEFRDYVRKEHADGPPDLCADCTRMLLTKLIESIP